MNKVVFYMVFFLTWNDRFILAGVKYFKYCVAQMCLNVSAACFSDNSN